MLFITNLLIFYVLSKDWCELCITLGKQFGKLNTPQTQPIEPQKPSKMTIIEQTITLSVEDVKDLVRKLIVAKLYDNDNATFSLKIIERGNAEIIFPFPNCLSIIEPVNDANGH